MPLLNDLGSRQLAENTTRLCAVDLIVLANPYIFEESSLVSLLGRQLLALGPHDT